MYKTLDLLYEKTSENCTVDSLEVFYNGTTANPSADKEAGEMFASLRSAGVGADTRRAIVVAASQRAAMYRIAKKAVELHSRGLGTDAANFADHISRDLDILADTPQKGSEAAASDLFVTDDIHTLLDGTVRSKGLRWRLNALNRILGSLRPGDFGFVFARPETGKTTFLCSEVSFMAEQIPIVYPETPNRPILHLNNEEQGQKVKLRYYQGSLGKTLQQILEDPDGCKEEFLVRTGGRIKIYDSAAIHKRQVEQLCKEHQPALVLVDQIDKIQGFDSDREDLRLGAIYQWARELAKSYCPIIGVCQAGGEGEGVRWLTMKHVANASTSKQAEADFIVGIGKTHDPNLEYVRHINVSKNKLCQDEDSDPEQRHGRCDVLIEPEVARYRDL